MMQPADLTLESQIDFAVLRLETATTPEKRREAWKILRDLIARRSPDRVREMERERGLAA